MVTNFKNTRENPTDAWNFYGEGTHNVKFWYILHCVLVQNTLRFGAYCIAF